LDIIRKAETAKNWIKSGKIGVDSLPELSQKLLELEKEVAPVYERMRKNSSLVRSFNMLYLTITLCKNATRDDWPKEKPWLDKRTLVKFISLIEEEEKWMAWAINETRTKPRYEDPSVPENAWDNHSIALFKAYRRVDSLTKPVKKEGDVEVEMSDKEIEEMYAKEEWVDIFEDLSDMDFGMGMGMGMEMAKMDQMRTIVGKLKPDSKEPGEEDAGPEDL
jgi:hypothetical protein